MTRPAYIDRFKSEALAVAKLNHPNIVHVYAIGDADQVHYIAMEYVEGTNLREYLRKKGALDLPLVLSIMKQTGQAIGAAGEAGLVHRDIKPENILITKRGRVKVADFGLCRDQAGEALSLTQSGVTMGTPLYMSPEQAQGHPVDHRSDLYSLGVTYYFMIAGEPPFRADSAVALALKHVREIPRSLMNYRPDLPLEIDRLVMKLMAKDPADRYQSAIMMLADLAKIRDLIQVGSAGLPDPYEGGSARTEDVVPDDFEQRTGRAGARAGPGGRRLRSCGPSRPRRDESRRESAGSLGGGSRAFSTHPVQLSSGNGGHGGRLVRRRPGGLVVPGPGRAVDPIEPGREPPCPVGRAAMEHDPEAGEPGRPGALRLAPGDPRRVGRRLARRPGALLINPASSSRGPTRSSPGPGIAWMTWRRSESWVRSWRRGTRLRARDKDLIAVIKTAIDMRTGDLKAVAESFNNLTPDGMKEMDDPTLVALRLEICLDALRSRPEVG